MTNHELKVLLVLMTKITGQDCALDNLNMANQRRIYNNLFKSLVWFRAGRLRLGGHLYTRRRRFR